MSETKITILCCHYTNEATTEDLAGIPARVEIKRFPCSGRIEVVDILRAMEEGAEAVMVAGCEMGTCHNKLGSLRASKRVKVAQEILQEIGLEPERIKMFFIPRLDTGAFIRACKQTLEALLEILEKRIQERHA